MKLDWFSISVTILLIMALVGINYSITHKVVEPFTEIYFDDFRTLPKITNGKNINFTYTINNLEKKDFTYNINISLEYTYNNITNIIVLKNENIEVKKNSNITRLESYTIGQSFDKLKTRVSLENKNQDIHFFSFYAKEMFNHPDYGIISLDCLPQAKTVNSDVAILSLRGTYAEGWPNALVYVDGKLIKNITVDSTTTREYIVDIKTSSGLHTMDIVFNNDKYIRNQTNNQPIADRNLYVDKIIILNKIEGIIDKGSNFGLYDCQDTYFGTDMYSSSSYRLRFYR